MIQADVQITFYTENVLKCFQYLKNLFYLVINSASLNILHLHCFLASYFSAFVFILVSGCYKLTGKTRRRRRTMDTGHTSSSCVYDATLLKLETFMDFQFCINNEMVS